MKKTCLLPALLLLVAVTVRADLTQNDVTSYITWYRKAHGAGPLTDSLEFKAWQAWEAVCERGWDHHPGTQAELSSLYASSGPCGPDQEEDEIKALQEWYKECPDYYGQGFAQNTGHFTHLVWKSCKSYGIWAQTCPNGSAMANQCVAALKMDCSHNMQGAFDQNVEYGKCANVDTPWNV